MLLKLNMDEDIQYIGTKLAPIHPPVTGIALHIQKSAPDTGYTLVFRRANTSVVHIGRRPGNDPDRRQRDNESGKAMFRCAVVSRKHARIAFSDAGHAYLIDMKSHHGTHILKAGEGASKMLKAETPTLLGDGDTITFGKAVGKNADLVCPVVARVELLCGSNPPTPTAPSLFMPLIVPATTTTTPGAGEENSPKSTASGRYGVYVPSSSSSSSSGDMSPSSPHSDHFSDIEEISQFDQSISRISNGTGSFGRAVDVIKRFLPPVHGSYYPAAPRDSSPIFLPSPVAQSPQPQQGLFAETTPPAPAGLFHPWSVLGAEMEHNVFDPKEDTRPRSRSRSHSSMDLASPSPAPPEPEAELPVVEAWPNLSVTEEPMPPSSESPAVSAPPAIQEPDTTFETDAIEVRPTIGPDAEVESLKSAVASLQGQVNKLHMHRRKYKARFNGNVHIMSEKLSDLDDQVNDINSQYAMLLDQVNIATHADIPDLQSQVDGLQRQVDLLQAPATNGTNTPASSPEREDIQESIHSLRDLVSEMKTLRESTQAQMAAELDAVRAARDAALASIAAHVQVCIDTPAEGDGPQPPPSPSLKRKRPDAEDVGEIDADEAEAMRVDECSDMDEAATRTSTTHDGPEVPARKRPRRVAAVMLHTATAVTIGAVATWSALAFS
ncbi:hypothetical protein BD779DRAFT_1541077 [Infundibulicybe gibba]|nr:hypothetical protein BD779DRAFT_1541077 [Infundibulicybe gibba]